MIIKKIELIEKKNVKKISVEYERANEGRMPELCKCEGTLPPHPDLFEALQAFAPRVARLCDWTDWDAITLHGIAFREGGVSFMATREVEGAPELFSFKTSLSFSEDTKDMVHEVELYLSGEKTAQEKISF